MLPIHNHLAHCVDTYSDAILWAGLCPAFLAPYQTNPTSEEKNKNKETQKQTKV